MVATPVKMRARDVTPIPMPAFSAVDRLSELDDADVEGDTDEPEVGALVVAAVCAGDADVDVDMVVDLAKEIFSPIALGKLATPARLEGHMIKPLLVPEHEH